MQRIPVEEINSLFDDGNFLFCKGNYEEAIVYYDRILKLDPCLRIALGYKGLALQRLKKHDEAKRCYQMALDC